ncbi:Hypothetical protein NTJ_12252 [Nesidiocoris tenuis]|uniref:Uncharacterized protein n=1 Tax=Nesidiocoris tenuis TaxID=355587 RepID=A0ABN7B8A7_9HEMI|nr:Hypothetical protein NTJ_12252 [Nesidiocoris tenuis]
MADNGATKGPSPKSFLVHPNSLSTPEGRARVMDRGASSKKRPPQPSYAVWPYTENAKTPEPDVINTVSTSAGNADVGNITFTRSPNTA